MTSTLLPRPVVEDGDVWMGKIPIDRRMASFSTSSRYIQQTHHSFLPEVMPTHFEL